MKQQIRQQYKQLRNQLSQEQVAQYSRQIINHLFDLDCWKESTIVMLYVSFQNEVTTQAIYQRGWDMGKTMLLPICSPQDSLMEMSILSSFEQLQPNRYGILELPKTAQQMVPPQEIDLCLIPGIAFDHFGNRLGFGAGYYDRYLAKLRPQTPRIALAYECQWYPGILPTNIYDLPMDAILTERALYQIKTTASTLMHFEKNKTEKS